VAGPITTVAFAGYITPIAGSASAYVFAGPTAQVTTTASAPRLTGAAAGVMALLAGGPINADVGLCYQSTLPMSPIVNFMDLLGYLTVEIGTTRLTYACAGSVIPTVGTYTVGMCVRNPSGSPISNNDYVNGWVQVTN